MSQLDGLLEIRHAASLRSGLKHAPCPLYRLGQLLTQPNRDPARLFAIDIFASLGSQDRGRSMPTVARTDQHRIDLFAIEQLAKVPMQLAIGVLIGPIDQRLGCLATTGLHIGNRNAAHIAKRQHRLEVVRRPRADTNDTQMNPLAGGVAPSFPRTCPGTISGAAKAVAATAAERERNCRREADMGTPECVRD